MVVFTDERKGFEEFEARCTFHAVQFHQKYPFSTLVQIFRLKIHRFVRKKYFALPVILCLHERTIHVAPRPMISSISK